MPPKEVSMRAKFDIKLHEAGWNTRADMAQHKNVLARLGTPSVEKDKHVKTPFVQKNGAPVEMFDESCRAVWMPDELPHVTVTKELMRNADASVWKEQAIYITLAASSKNNAATFSHPQACFGCACVHLQDYVPINGDLQNMHPSVTILKTHADPLFPGFYLKLEIQVTSELKVARANASNDANSDLGQILSSEKNAREYEMQIICEFECSFSPGSFVGVVPEQPSLPCMLLHRLSQLETCDQSASNCIGQVAHVRHDHARDFAIVRIKMGRHLRVRQSSMCSSRCQIPGIQINAWCIFPGVEAAKADEEEKLAETKVAEEARPELFQKQQECYLTFQDLKQKALSASQAPFSLNSNEFGMVCLRRCFLASQRLISKILVCLMQREDWYGAEWKHKCKVLFGSEEGPWDIFKMVQFLMPHYEDDAKDIFGMTVTALHPLKCNAVERDEVEKQLFNILHDIHCVRCWWAHLGAGIHDCTKARLKINEFLLLVYLSGSKTLQDCFSDSDIANIDNVDKDLALGLSVDDVAFVIFGRAKLQLCELCVDISANLPGIEFSKLLKAELLKKAINVAAGRRRQSSIVEISDVLAVIKNIDKSSKFLCHDCDMVTSCRNSLSHATGMLLGDQVISVLVALSSVSRITEFVKKLVSKSSFCPYPPQSISNLKPSPLTTSNIEDAVSDMLKYCESCRDGILMSQAELLARSKICDISNLIQHFFASDQIIRAIDQCSFQNIISHHSHPIMQHRSLQLLLEQKVHVPRETEPLNSVWTDSKFKPLRSLLHFIAHIPPNHTQSLDQALEWLLSTGGIESLDLLQCFGPNILVAEFESGFFPKYRESDQSGYLLFEKFCLDFKTQQETNSRLRKKMSEYFQACSKSPNVFGKAEEKFQWHNRHALASFSSELEIWTSRTEYLEIDHLSKDDAHHVSAHDVHELYEIAKSIKLLMTMQSEIAQSITQMLNMQRTELKRFLKRLVIIFSFHILSPLI